jgi:hypothetical protein
MKRILGGMVVAAALSGSAFAADLPLRTYTKAPAMPGPGASGDQSCEQMRLAGKKSAGRSLDGIEHNEMPLDKLALEQFGLRAAITGIALPKGKRDAH